LAPLRENNPTEATSRKAAKAQKNATMTARERISSGAKWESIVGYSRAVKVGSRIYVTGTTAIDDQGELVADGDAYGQARQCLVNIEKALKRLGAGFEHVVRTRMFVTDISRWEEYGRAHGEIFHAIMPATSMVEVSALIDPRMLIEIEADAEI
jgi:enamine deaminase RidA (YjgF/YER057c/UK114 family)